MTTDFGGTTLSPIGAVVKWYERLAVVRKVAGSSPARAEDWETLTATQQRMGTWLTLGKVEGGERRDWVPPFTCRAKDTMRL